uniref:Reverse transcriptase Ty1/copia-type domain-containing protein n=1 Tax=Micrurus lemniscatus lemniscatus TaxID=129467 RepID=A0A2D4HEN5_MICLE
MARLTPSVTIMNFRHTENDGCFHNTVMPGMHVLPSFPKMRFSDLQKVRETVKPSGVGVSSKDCRNPVGQGKSLWGPCGGREEASGDPVASFATDVPTRKSMSGTVVLLGKALIVWRSIRQKHLSLSTTEAEFSCLSLLCTDLVCYKQLMIDMGSNVKEPILVYEDNQSAIQWLPISP